MRRGLVVSLLWITSCGSRSQLDGSALADDSSAGAGAGGGARPMVNGGSSAAGAANAAGSISFGGTSSNAGVGGTFATAGAAGNASMGGFAGMGGSVGGAGVAGGGAAGTGGSEGQTTWTQTDSERGRQVGVAIAGLAQGAWATGYFDTATSIGSGVIESLGESDFYLARFDRLGKVVGPTWIFQGDRRQEPSSLAVDSQGHVALGGSFQGTISKNANLVSAGSFDGFVLRFDEAGELTQQLRFGDNSNQYVSALDFDDNDELVVVGAFGKTFDVGLGTVTSAGAADWFLLRLAPDNTPLSSRPYGGVGNERAEAVAAWTQGRAWVTGTFDKPVDFGCGELSSSGGRDVFVVQLGADGDCLQSFALGSAADDSAGDIAVGPNGHIVVVGTYGASDYFITGRDGENGAEQYFHTLPSAAGWTPAPGFPSPLTPHVDIDGQGFVLVCGGFSGSVALGDFVAKTVSSDDANAFVLKLKADGQTVWAKTFGDLGDQVAYDVSAFGEQVLVTGSFEGVLTGTSTNPVSAAAEDAFFLSLPR